jgi:hypothetical protein
MRVSTSIKVPLSYIILTSHLNLLWYHKDDGVIYIKGRLIRHAEYGVIINELDLKKVFNLEKRLKKSLPYH